MTVSSGLRRIPGVLAFALLAAACGQDASTVEPPDITPVVASLEIEGGDNQTAAVGSALGTTLTVKALTATGAPVAGVHVLFRVSAGAAALDPATDTTSSDGTASTRVTLGAVAGPVQVSASVSGAATGTAADVMFHATANPIEPDSTAAPTVYNPDWTEATHGKVAPDYLSVFPQDAVNSVEITMTPAQWAGIRANMTALYGFDFGTHPNAGGAFPEDDPAYIAVSLKHNGKLWKKVGYRLKGNSTLASAWGSGNYKLPFRLKLNEWEDVYPAIRNQRFYGFKELSFSPGRSDPSLIREKSTSDILRMAGIPAAQTAFYRVYVDFGAGLKYCGVYTMVEVIDDTMVKSQFGEDKGNIYKPESPLRAFNEADFEKKNNKTSDYNDVRSFIIALNSSLRTSNPAQWRTNLEALFNVDHFLKWLAVNNAIVNWDSYGTMPHNYYLYNSPSAHLTWIPWDHNEAMLFSPGITGSVNPGPNVRGLSLTMNEVSNSWPLIRNLIDDPVYLAKYREHLRAFNTAVLGSAAVDAMLDRYTALITPYVTGANGEQPGYSYTTPSAFAAALPALKTHLANRRSLVSTFVQ